MIKISRIYLLVTFSYCMKIYGENDNPLNSVQVPAIIINKLPESNNFKNSFPLHKRFLFSISLQCSFSKPWKFLEYYWKTIEHRTISQVTSICNLSTRSILSVLFVRHMNRALSEISEKKKKIKTSKKIRATKKTYHKNENKSCIPHK